MLVQHHADCLTIFYYGTFVPVANGGNARLVQLLDRIEHEFERVVLYCYSDHPDRPWSADAESAFRARWPRVELVLERYTRAARLVTKLKNVLIPAVPRWADRLIRLRLPGATPAFDALKARTGVFLLSYTEALTQVNGIDPRRCFVETHDVNFLKWSKIHQRKPTSLTALRKFRGEVALLEPVRAALAISPPEHAFFRMMLKAPHVPYVSSWASPRPAQRRRDQADQHDLVFVGSDYVMNARGLCDLLATHGDWLAPYRIAICGRVCLHDTVIEAAGRHPNVHLLGYVDDIDAVYRRSRAALSPVDGTGVKMKIFAALAHGLPVFASAKSQEGLPPGFEGAVFDIAPGPVAAVLGSESGQAKAHAAAERYHAVINAAGEADAVLTLMRSLVPTNGRPATRTT